VVQCVSVALVPRASCSSAVLRRGRQWVGRVQCRAHWRRSQRL